MSLVLVFVRTYSGVLLHTVEPEVCKVCFRLQVCFDMVVLVDTGVFVGLAALVVRLHSRGRIWRHLGLLGVTQFHLVSLSFADTGTHRFLGLFPHDSCSLRCARPVGGSIFSPFREKRLLGVTWINFFAKIQVFQKIADEVFVHLTLHH